MRRVVERPGDDVVDGGAGQAGDLGAQLVAGPAGRGSDVGLGAASSSATSCSSRARPSSSSAAAWVSASASRRARSASMSPLAWRIWAASASAATRPPHRHRAQPGSWRCGRHALLHRRAGELPQQEEDDHRGGDAEEHLVALGPELRRRLGDVVGGQECEEAHVAASCHQRRRRCVLTGVGVGTPPVASSAARLLTSATAASMCCCSRGLGRVGSRHCFGAASGDASVGLGQRSGALGLQRLAGGVDPLASLGLDRRPAPLRTRQLRPWPRRESASAVS